MKKLILNKIGKGEAFVVKQDIPNKFVTITQNNIRFFGSYNESSNGVYLVAFADGHLEKISNEERWIDGQIILLKDLRNVLWSRKLERPNDAFVSDNGRIALTDWLRSKHLGGKFYVFDQSENTLFEKQFDSNLGTCAISKEGKYAAVSTLFPENSIHFFDNENGILTWSYKNHGNKVVLGLSFSQDSRILVYTGKSEATRRYDYSLDFEGKLPGKGDKLLGLWLQIPKSTRDVPCTAWCRICSGRILFEFNANKGVNISFELGFWLSPQDRKWNRFGPLPKLCTNCEKKYSKRLEKYNNVSLPVVFWWDRKELISKSEAKYGSYESEEAQYAFTEYERLRRLGRTKDAEEMYGRYVDLTPVDVSKYYTQTTIRVHSSGVHTNHKITKSPEFIVNANRGVSLYRKAAVIHDPHKVIQYLKETLKLNPYYDSYPPFWSKLGACLQKLGKHGEAVECFNKRIDIEQNSPSASVLFGKAVSLMELHRLDEAKVIMKNLVKKIPSSKKYQKKLKECNALLSKQYQ